MTKATKKKITTKKTTRKAPGSRVNKDQDNALDHLCAAVGQLCDALTCEGGTRAACICAANENIEAAQQLIVVAE